MIDPRPRHLIAPAGLLAASIAAAAGGPLLGARFPFLFGIETGPAIRAVTAAVTWLSLAWLVTRICDLLLLRSARRAGRPAPYPRLLHDLLRAVLFGVAALAILLLVLGEAATGLLATSSVLIAVVGFALRNIIGDVFSGIALGIDHAYRIGDWIEVGTAGAGQVVEINWRATRLVTRDGISVVVPNGLLAGQRLVNYSAPEAGFRTSLTVALDPSVPVSRAKRVILSGALDAARTYHGLRPDVVVREYGDSGVLFQLRFWVPDYGQENHCRDAVASSVLRALRSAGLKLSYPKHDLLIDRGRADPPDRGLRRESLVAEVDLFRIFDADERRQLARAMAERFIPAGETVVGEGDEGSSLFILAEGTLDVAARRAGGADEIMDRLVPGDVFGEMSLLTGQPRSATIRAVIDAVAYEIRKEDIDPVLRRRPELAAALASLMADRQRHNANARHALDEAAPASAPTRDDLLTRIRALFRLH